MVQGKSFSLYMMDDELTGRVKGSLTGYNGIVYRIPRNSLDLCKEQSLLDHLAHCGIYLLLGSPQESE